MDDDVVDKRSGVEAVHVFSEQRKTLAPDFPEFLLHRAEGELRAHVEIRKRGLRRTRFDMRLVVGVLGEFSEEHELRKFHGLARSLMANAVAGVNEGFKRELDIVGVGYRAELKGQQVVFALGYSHPVVFDIPKGIDVVIDKQTHITVTGVDCQLVGQVAANIRRLRKPDPYKQKGVRYMGEVLKKKVGKTGA